ncbi:hypothetical protein EP7_003709 [Isosphaeraceae bacterium EP7]
MKTLPIMMLGLGTALVLVLTLGIAGGRIPTGVVGEWTWLKIPFSPNLGGLTLGLAVVVAYALFAGLGWRGVARKGRARTFWLVGLTGGSALTQLALTSAAPIGYDFAKWSFALYSPGSSGYYTVAKQQVSADPRRFLAEYPAWIKGQDALHVGTHPPGLFMTSYAMLRLMEKFPSLARVICDFLPRSLDEGYRQLDALSRLPRADRAAMAATGLLMLLACSATVLPIYALARISVEPRAAWCAAALWPVVPSSILFGPGADTAFPLLATLALALTGWSGVRRGRLGFGLAIGAGLALGVGTLFTLAFFPVGLIAGLILGSARLGIRPRLERIGAVGGGFLAIVLLFWAITGANPFVVWWWNQANHGRFYVEYPRTYWIWIFVNVLELAVGLGLPIFVWALAGLGPRTLIPRPVWAGVGVLILLNLSGKNLSEVARIWLIFMPTLVIAAGWGMARLGGGARTLGATIVLTGLQTMALQVLIQVVYPT